MLSNINDAAIELCGRWYSACKNIVQMSANTLKLQSVFNSVTNAIYWIYNTFVNGSVMLRHSMLDNHGWCHNNGLTNANETESRVVKSLCLMTDDGLYHWLTTVKSAHPWGESELSAAYQAEHSTLRLRFSQTIVERWSWLQSAAGT